jgi:hypothetical protein
MSPVFAEDIEWAKRVTERLVEESDFPSKRQMLKVYRKNYLVKDEMK